MFKKLWDGFCSYLKAAPELRIALAMLFISLAVQTYGDEPYNFERAFTFAMLPIIVWATAKVAAFGWYEGLAEKEDTAVKARIDVLVVTVIKQAITEIKNIALKADEKYEAEREKKVDASDEFDKVNGDDDYDPSQRNKAQP